MNFSKLFPEQYRAFYNGPLSCCVERFGGVNSISLLDVREFGGKLYPDRFPVPWLSRNGSTMGQPLFGPAIRLMHGHGQYVPENAELHPFGFRSEHDSLLLTQRAMAFRLNGHGDGTFRMTISRLHMTAGRMQSLKNQLSVVASGIQWLPPELRGPGFDPATPFPDNGMELVRFEPEFDAARGTMLFRVECRYADHVKEQFWAIAADRPLALALLPTEYELSAPTEAGRELRLGFGFAANREEALREAAALRDHFDAAFDAACRADRPELELAIEGMPEAAEFLKEFPVYQRHLLLAETGREVAIRAAADKFGFFALWDHLYPARDFLLTGEPERTAKALRYMLDYPHVETCLWITMQLIVTVDEYLAFTDDRAFLAEAMPHFRRYFAFAERFLDPVTGLVKATLNCGVDNSRQAGLSGLFFASCLNGWWYDACRVLENFALETGDAPLANRCRETAEKIDAHYEAAFYVPAQGYLRAARNDDGSPPAIEIYQNTHTLGLDYLHGRHLFRRIMGNLATYQAEKLHHPMGHTAVSFDSAVPCEMWKFVHMNQHLGHECKLARYAGRVGEAYHVMQGYLDYFARYRTAIETFNYAGCDGDACQTSNWQAFSATAAAQGLCRALAGLEYHRGGLAWTPAEDHREIRLRNLRFRNRLWHLHVSGSGDFGRMYVNGHMISGTMQIPADLVLDTENEWRIERTAERPAHPVLLLAPDAPVKAIQCENETLAFTVCATLRTPLLIAAPRPPHLTVNSAEQHYEWNDSEKTLWFDHLFHCGDRVHLT